MLRKRLHGAQKNRKKAVQTSLHKKRYSCRTYRNAEIDEA
jgi:hypothetical protein